MKRNSFDRERMADKTFMKKVGHLVPCKQQKFEMI